MHLVVRVQLLQANCAGSVIDLLIVPIPSTEQAPPLLITAEKTSPPRLARLGLSGQVKSEERLRFTRGLGERNHGRFTSVPNLRKRSRSEVSFPLYCSKTPSVKDKRNRREPRAQDGPHSQQPSGEDNCSALGGQRPCASHIRNTVPDVVCN